MTPTHSVITIEDLRQLARRRLPSFVFDPIEHGAGEGQGSRSNIAAFRDYRFHSRVLVDVSPVSTSTTLFGRTYASPLGVSAVGSCGLLRRHADLLLAEAAREADIPFILSSSANATVEEATRVAPEHVWYQLYSPRDPEISDHMMGRAAAAGVEVLVCTVDLPVRPRNEVMLRTGVSLTTSPPLRHMPALLWDAVTHPRWTLPYLLGGGRPSLAGWKHYAGADASVRAIGEFFATHGVVNHTWHELERIRRVWKGKLVVKGIMHADDAKAAVTLGADAITVSNHGGNRLAWLPASLEMLPSISEAVGKQVPVLFDGGIRRGADLVIARALGASHCFTGRATLYGVVAGGSEGARKAISILRDDMVQTMAMIGCKELSNIGPDCLLAPGRSQPTRR